MLISRRAYAASKGVSEKAVRKAIAAGKIPLVEGQIDPEIADAAWQRNRDAGQQSKLADAIAAEGAPELPAASVPGPPAGEQPKFEMAPLTTARIRNTEESTLIKEITRRRLEGDLLDAEEVERTWAEVLQTIKDRLRLIPDNIGEMLAATSEPAECRSIVMREILDALTVLSKNIAGMAA